MHKIKFLILLALLLAAAFAQGQLSDPESLKICAGVKDVQLPAQDQPSATETKALANCSSEKLYYGYEKTPDYVQARKCAYAEVDRGVKDVPFAGRTILMMVYANGRGAAQNLDVALKLACEVPGAPGDWAGRIHQLERMRASGGKVGSFGICDHSSGKYMYEQCAMLSDRFDKMDREKQIQQIEAKWTTADKKALEALRQAAAPFFHLRATKETDLTITFEVQEIAFLENSFIEMLQKAEAGEIPSFSPEDVKRIDADLNDAYTQTQDGKTAAWGTVTREDIKGTQAAWMKYRDAWVAFGKKKYPKVSEAMVKTWLTQQRREMLEKFLH
jgi:uncharacterized protein YecT (DUF1311 family)